MTKGNMSHGMFFWLCFNNGLSAPCQTSAERLLCAISSAVISWQSSLSPLWSFHYVKKLQTCNWNVRSLDYAVSAESGVVWNILDDEMHGIECIEALMIIDAYLHLVKKDQQTICILSTTGLGVGRVSNLKTKVDKPYLILKCSNTLWSWLKCNSSGNLIHLVLERCSCDVKANCLTKLCKDCQNKTTPSHQLTHPTSKRQQTTSNNQKQWPTSNKQYSETRTCAVPANNNTYSNINDHENTQWPSPGWWKDVQAWLLPRKNPQVESWNQ